MQFIENGILGKFIFNPLYNALIWFTGLFPGASIAIGVILLTIIVKLVLAPLAYRSIIHQVQQKKLQPLIDEIKKKYKDNKEEQSKQILAFYKEHKTNPFSGCLLLLIQLPILLALYHVFLNIQIVPERLYSFVSAPEALNPLFFGIDLGGKSIILALLVGITAFLQIYFSPAMRDVKPIKSTDSQNDTEKTELAPQVEMMQGMQKSMKYSMPVMMGVFGYILPAALALYLLVSNIFTIAQETVIRRKIDKDEKSL